jgi:hypothetical protein
MVVRVDTAAVVVVVVADSGVGALLRAARRKNTAATADDRARGSMRQGTTSAVDGAAPVSGLDEFSHCMDPTIGTRRDEADGGGRRERGNEKERKRELSLGGVE